MALADASLGSGKSVVLKGRYSSYQVHGVLGKGGSAVVYHATDLATLQTVAAKRISALDDDATHQWRTEVEALMTLKDVEGSHHVIRYLDHLVHENAILIVEEFAANGSLQTHLKQRGCGFEERDVAALVHQITSGLAFIHSNDIVHRDLKCANALVCADGQVKLSDFGLSTTDPKRLAGEAAKAARAAGTNSSSGGGANAKKSAAAEEEAEEEGANPVMGSVYWMAPETIRGQEASPSSDIWSLGCLCIELLTGCPPFFDRPPASALYCIVEGKEPVPLPNVPLSEAGSQFIQSCLAYDPSRRPTAKQLLRSPWFADVRVQSRLDAIVAQVTREADDGSSGAVVVTSTPHRLTGNDGRPSEVSSSVRGGSKGISSALAEGTDSVGQWVEANLFSDSPMRNAAWARENVPKLALALPSLTPAEAHDTVRSFAFASAVMGPALVDPLGQSAFWRVPSLNRTGETPLHAVTLFEACCQCQDPAVHVFAASCPRAIAFLLSSACDGVARRCVESLHRLYCPSASSPSPTEVSQRGAGGEPTCSRLERALQRLVADGGLLALRSFIEAECEASFAKDEPPAIGWPLLDKLFEVLASARGVEGAEALLWRGETTALHRGVKSMSESSPSKSDGREDEDDNDNDDDDDDDDDKDGEPPPQQHQQQYTESKVATATAASRDRHDRRDGDGSTIAVSTDEVSHSLDAILGAAQQPTVRWYLAIQEAARSGVAPCAAEMLIDLVHHLAQAAQQRGQKRSPETLPLQQQQPPTKGTLRTADHTPREQSAVRDTAAAAEVDSYLERAGVSLAGVLISLACCHTMPDRVRIRVLQTLPVLQSCSARAAGFLADEHCAIPLYAYTLHRVSGASPGGGRREALHTLRELSRRDRRVLVGCARSSLFAHALSKALCAAAVHPGDSPPRGDDAGGSEEEEEAAAATPLSLCWQLLLLLKGTASAAESPVTTALAAELVECSEAVSALLAYANDPATPAEQAQLGVEVLKMVAVAQRKASVDATPSNLPAAAAAAVAAAAPPPAPGSEGEAAKPSAQAAFAVETADTAAAAATGAVGGL